MVGLCLEEEEGDKGLEHLFSFRPMEDPNLWAIQKFSMGEDDAWVWGEVLGHMIVYVDDILMVGPKKVTEAASATIQNRWSTSAPEYAAVGGNSMRFLGIEIQRPKDGSYFLHQECYAREIIERRQDAFSSPFIKSRFEAQHRQNRAEESRLKARGLATGSEFSSTQSSEPSHTSAHEAESSDDNSDLYFQRQEDEDSSQPLEPSPCSEDQNLPYCAPGSSLLAAMGAKCCAGEEAQEHSMDSPDGSVTESRPKPRAFQEEIIQQQDDAKEGLSIPAISRKGEPIEFEIKLTKTYGKSRLGVDVDLTDGFGLVVDQVTEGLIRDWNQVHPEQAVIKGDRIVAVNGVRGNSNEITEVCKSQAVLELVIQRS
eukprot:g157.t1